ncbi:MAG: serine protease AprX, partial [Glaciecola sp.]
MSNIENIKKTNMINKITTAILGSSLALSAFAWGLTSYSSGEEYILQGASRPALISAIQAENGVIIHEFKIIQAVSAKLTDAQVIGISSRNAMIRFFNEDQEGELASSKSLELSGAINQNQYAASNSNVPMQVGADKLHINGITGKGVTVAMIDSGLSQSSAIQQNTSGYDRNITLVSSDGDVLSRLQDLNGHGSNVASILADSTSTFDQYGSPTGSHNGIAPDVDLVMIKAFDKSGESSYSTVLQGIEYAIDNKDALNIKVLNVAFSFPATSFYWEDPINQALMRAWDSGITVIAAAGNGGNQDMSIGVPGNNPYVITVGAMDDNATPFNTSDDRVASFSSFGPTVEGFLKPELIAPGVNVKGAAKNSRVSGTSQATAAAAGIVALMIQQDPSLTPDEIKCRLMSSASQAKYANGQLAFSPFAQGAGLVNAAAAIDSTAVGCANNGLNILNDINQTSHYFGPAGFDSETNEFTLGTNNRHTDGVIWYGANGKKAAPAETDGVIWYGANGKKAAPAETDGVIWYGVNGKKAAPAETDGVIWYGVNGAKAAPAETDGVIWYGVNGKKAAPAETDGVIWYGANGKKVAPTETDGVIWYGANGKKAAPAETDGVIWYGANGKKAAPAETDGVIWYGANGKKAAPAETDGVIWYGANGKKAAPAETDGVIWYGVNGKKVAPAETDGVIWYGVNGAKAAPAETDGVIWYGVNGKKAAPAETNGVIWYGANGKKVAPAETDGVIWYGANGKKVAPAETDGVIWYGANGKK